MCKRDDGWCLDIGRRESNPRHVAQNEGACDNHINRWDSVIDLHWERDSCVGQARRSVSGENGHNAVFRWCWIHRRVCRKGGEQREGRQGRHSVIGWVNDV